MTSEVNETLIEKTQSGCPGIMPFAGDVIELYPHLYLRALRRSFDGRHDGIDIGMTKA
jgi:hypothetical protein